MAAQRQIAAAPAAGRVLRHLRFDGGRDGGHLRHQRLQEAAVAVEGPPVTGPDGHRRQKPLRLFPKGILGRCPNPILRENCTHLIFDLGPEPD